MFDGAILDSYMMYVQKFGLIPRMARALHGRSKCIAEERSRKICVGVKGTEIQNTMGKHIDDFTTEELSRFAEYAINDVDLTYDIFKLML